MTPHERGLAEALGRARAEITRLRLIADQASTASSYADVVAAAHRAEAQAWLDYIGADPDAPLHLAVLAGAA